MNLFVILVTLLFAAANAQWGFGGLFGGGGQQVSMSQPGLFGSLQQGIQQGIQLQQQQQQRYTQPPVAVDTPQSNVLPVIVDNRAAPDVSDEKNSTHETHFPCMGRTVSQTRYTGQVTPENNYWSAVIDLSMYTYYKSIKLVIEVDNPAEIVIDPEIGKISGEKTGTMFRVTYFGTPANMPTVDFKIIGTNGIQFPNLKSLLLNNREICKGATNWISNLAEGLTGVLFGTTNALGGLLGGLTSGNNAAGQQFPQGQQATIKPQQTTTTTPRPKPTPRVVPGCGRRQINQQAYITEGYASKPGDWPWHVALYHRDARTSSYRCGGSLINDRTVLTAAHCLFVNGRVIVPERVSVHLGKFKLSIIDTNTAEYQVLEVVVHPEYSPIDFQDDIALLKLGEKVSYTQHIQPVCLWKSEERELSAVEGKTGTVVGWGLNEKDETSEILSEGTMPVVGFFTCLESNRDFFGPFLSDYNYCAGHRNGTSVCNGDSGGGMFFQRDGQWYIRGLVSFSSVREDRDVCNPKNYVIFTDVAKYLDWIDESTKLK